MIGTRRLLCVLLSITCGWLTACYHDDTASRRAVNGLLAAAAGDEEQTVPRLDARAAGLTLPQQKKKWTVLVYLDADNNLSPYAEDDVAEMMETGSGPDLNVVLLWDDAGKKKPRHGYYYVTKEGAALVKDLGEVNMGDPATAAAFIDFAVSAFPAEKYLWIWWNHGGAVDRAVARGVAWDDSSEDHLSETEQREVMQQLKRRIGKKIDIVGFDACLMATAEIAAQYADLATYLVASEQTEPAAGWDYSFLSAAAAKPGISARSLSYAILKEYKSFYREEDDATLSVVYLAHVSALVSDLDAFAASAIACGAAGRVFRDAAKGLPMFGEYFDGDRTRYFTKDLHAYLTAVVASRDVPAQVKERAAACAARLIDKKLIPYRWNAPAWEGKAAGLSITLKRATKVYRELELCRRTAWDEFLNWAEFPSNDYKL